MVNTQMIHWVMVLMGVFCLSTLIWAAYTFLRMPGQYRNLLQALQEGQPAPIAMHRLDPPLWLPKIIMLSQGSLIIAILLVFFLHLDVDFTLFLILATLASGVIWFLDVQRIRPLLQQCRRACAEATLTIEEPPIVEYGHAFFRSWRLFCWFGPLWRSRSPFLPDPCYRHYRSGIIFWSASFLMGCAIH